MSRDAIQSTVDTDLAGNVEEQDECDVCHGDGGWTWTVEYQGREVETDRDCPACEGTGVAL